MYHIIDKGMVKPWLRKLIKQGILVAPTVLEGGDVVFKESFTPDNISLEFKQPLYSVKSFFLPREETLFTFHSNSIDSVQEVYDELPRVFFGLRPCDLKAIRQADRFFAEGIQDSHYYHRRERTLLIVIGCNDPESHCFCHVMGDGPFQKTGADIFMVDLGGSFAVTTDTPQGFAAIRDYPYFFEEVTEEQEYEIYFKESFALSMLNKNMPMDLELPSFSSIGDEFWEETSLKCFSCGSCSYICPMCFCYNVVDRQNKFLEGKRIRTWDSCIFEGFTRMAGGHNLLGKRKDRLKKRFAHKLQQYPQKYGFMGCTGCGRCSITCMGKIGMLDIIRKLVMEVGTDGKE
jgi:ferredoxin